MKFTWLEKNVCREPDLNNEPIIPYARSILWVTSLIDALNLDMSGFSWVLESRFLITKKNLVSQVPFKNIDITPILTCTYRPSLHPDSVVRQTVDTCPSTHAALAPVPVQSRKYAILGFSCSLECRRICDRPRTAHPYLWRRATMWIHRTIHRNTRVPCAVRPYANQRAKRQL